MVMTIYRVSLKHFQRKYIFEAENEVRRVKHVIQLEQGNIYIYIYIYILYTTVYKLRKLLLNNLVFNCMFQLFLCGRLVH